jgi:hypothetical protein
VERQGGESLIGNVSSATAAIAVAVALLFVAAILFAAFLDRLEDKLNDRDED